MYLFLFLYVSMILSCFFFLGKLPDFKSIYLQQLFYVELLYRLSLRFYFRFDLYKKLLYDSWRYNDIFNCSLTFYYLAIAIGVYLDFLYINSNSLRRFFKVISQNITHLCVEYFDSYVYFVSFSSCFPFYFLTYWFIS